MTRRRGRARFDSAQESDRDPAGPTRSVSHWHESPWASESRDHSQAVLTEKLSPAGSHESQPEPAAGPGARVTRTVTVGREARRRAAGLPSLELGTVGYRIELRGLYQ